ncbi:MULTISPECIES: 3-hydroxyacyl-CoA dehydrogenase family protein [Xanthobacter]|uniref:3-hydroxyacyl-CoA dehydrogenase family protein n=1 Tax=Xanthobacter aminoxidans TaxID=186280 RepID=A0ABW6ZQT3_9HYPH|nr:3-hydroxyacyl-CoA dehydrogenase family protein [Xanthobacter sp. 91]
MAWEWSAAAVAGAGTMGAGIAITIARSGLNTFVFDESPDALDRAKRQVEAFFESSVRKGKLDAAAAAAATARLSYVKDVSALAEADVVVEAIYEELAAKQRLLSTLNAVCRDDTLFLTNTSTLSITELAAGSGRPDRVVGAHYCLPAQLMRLVEMSTAIQTSAASWDQAWAFQRATGQHPVETKDRPGFVLNFFCVPYHNDVIRMVEAGVAEPADIDKAVKAAMGFAMGPCELIDLIGLDTQLRASEAFFSVTNNPRTFPPPLLRRMVAAGQLGRKTRRGFFDYGSDALFGA